MVLTPVSSSLIASRRMRRTNPSEYWTARRSRKLMFLSNIRSSLCCLIRPCSRTHWKRWIPTTTTRLPNGREKFVMPTFSSPVSVWVNNWLPPSRHRLCRRRSKFSSPKRTWRTSLENLASPRCCRPDKTNSNRTRSSIFLQNPLPYTSYGPSSALGAPRVSRSLVLRHWRRSHCWIRPTHHSTSSYGKKTSSQSTSNDWRASFSSATRIIPSSSTGTGGEPGQTGELHGKEHRRRSLFSTPTSLHLSLASLKYGTWRAARLYTLSQRRTLGGCTHPPERYAQEHPEL